MLVCARLAEVESTTRARKRRERIIMVLHLSSQKWLRPLLRHRFDQPPIAFDERRPAPANASTMSTNYQ
jgi:hypothetical protein